MRLGAFAVAAAVVTAVAAGASPASAMSGTTAPEPWEPISQQEWTAPAGTYCDFPLHLVVLFDAERTRVLQRHPDGSVKQREYIGALVTEFVNVDTGAGVRINASAQGVVDLRPDGTVQRFTGHGPFGIGFRSTDPYPRGYYLLTGEHTVEIDPDGTKHMVVDSGTEENICDALD